MKSKASLMLMEQLIMVVIFALAAALCLQGFVKADEISAGTARQDRAVMIAQNAAELLRRGKTADDIPVDEGYALNIHREETDIPGLARARIDVSFGEEILFTLNTGWQEVAS